MMGLFGKSGNVDVDERKVRAFIDWFLENSDRITASVINRMQDRKTMLTVMDEVGEQLGLVYRDGYKGKVEFDYYEIGDKWELNLYHSGKPFLMKATKKIADGINSLKHPLWTVHINK